MICWCLQSQVCAQIIFKHDLRSSVHTLEAGSRMSPQQTPIVLWHLQMLEVGPVRVVLAVCLVVPHRQLVLRHVKPAAPEGREEIVLKSG